MEKKTLTEDLTSAVLVDDATFQNMTSGGPISHDCIGTRPGVCVQILPTEFVMKDSPKETFHFKKAVENMANMWRPGDWYCVCKNHNHASDDVCPKCGRKHHPHKRGDWDCARCGEHNFAWRDRCRKCNLAPRCNLVHNVQSGTQ